jgi:hypothetical protein
MTTWKKLVFWVLFWVLPMLWVLIMLGGFWLLLLVRA